MPIDPAVDDAARAILDGAPLDWSGLESSTDLETLALVEQLKVLSALAGVHRAETPSGQAERVAVAENPRPDGPVYWGHLQLKERIGAGAYGEVFRAWDTRLDREVALKLLSARASETRSSSPLIQEGRMLARVRHPNVATIYGAEMIDGRIGLWMEFVRGRTFEALLRSGHQFSWFDVVAIGQELCRAVSAVHAAGVLHRDIKAQNVMRADDGRVVLMDFGTGHDQTDGDASPAGTPLYLAPEVFRRQPATVRSDIYSIGVLLYRLLSGAYPVEARTLADLREVHARGTRNDLRTARPDLPPGVVRIVSRAIEADPARRYATCDELAAELAAVARPSRRRWLAPIALAAGLAVVAWLSWDVGRQAGRTSGAVRTGSAAAFGSGRTALSPSERPVIAVLPFKNLSSDAQSDLIVDGLTYELIRNLAIIDGLDVKSATSSFAFKNTPPNLAEVGRQLGVNLVLEGSVLKTGDQWRVHAQLAQVAGDTPLWSRKFDRSGQGALSIQDDIALAVVNELRLKLGGGQRRYEITPPMFAVYLQARALVERRGSKNAEAALKLFEEVLAGEPGFAPAYAGLADAYAFLSQDLPDVGGMPPDRAMTLMRPVAEKAIAIDPLLAEAHAAMGILHSREHRWEEAQSSFHRAIDLNPSLTHVYTNFSLTTLLPLGKFADAQSLLDEALRRDPLSTIVLREIGSQQLAAGRYADAIRTFDQVMAIDPALAYVVLLRARALSLAGRIDEAMPYWEAQKSFVGSQHWMAYAFVRAGRRAEVEQWAAQPQQHPYRLAIFHTALGNVDQAIDALEKAADLVPQRVVRLLIYPELASLRGHPRFEALRARFGLR